jgi:hypothetical protein
MIERVNDLIVDKLEELMLSEGEVVDCPLVHRFTNGMYIRQIFMPKGSLVTSKIHNTEHPFTVSLGAAAVSIDGNDWEHIVSPYTGITQPGTRRILYILEDCIWTTYHPVERMKSEFNNLEGEELDALITSLEDELLMPYVNQITGKDMNKEYKEILSQTENIIDIWHSQPQQ